MRKFKLIETMLWENGRFFMMGPHLARLKKSARFFGFFFSRGKIEKSLREKTAGFNPAEKYRVRLLLNKTGKAHLEADKLSSIDSRFCGNDSMVRGNDINANLIKIAVSNKQTNKDNIFLRHKTTNRVLYDRELARWREKGFFECLFMNEKDEITEGAISNIVIEKSGTFWTPPVKCGLLPGVYREYLLKKGKLKEKILHLEDLYEADRVYIVNSVRKTLRAVIAAP